MTKNDLKALKMTKYDKISNNDKKWQNGLSRLKMSLNDLKWLKMT